jgi:hypothetical protein
MRTYIDIIEAAAAAEDDNVEAGYKASKKGASARSAGKGLEDNPHAKMSELYHHWKNGWKERNQKLKAKGQ